MAEPTLYTVNIYKISKDQEQTTPPLDSQDLESTTQSSNHHSQNNHNHDLTNKMSFIDNFKNMISAKVMNGNMVELEHSKLVGPTVKFKSVINYNDSLETDNSLGVIMVQQSSYIAPT